MAGSSNPKFLIPSDFTKSKGNFQEKTSQNSSETVLMPPSTYEKVKQNNLPKNICGKSMEKVVLIQREDAGLRQTSEKLLKEKRDLCYAKEQSSKERARKEQAVQSELHLARCRVADLEQEKEILQYELQDREALCDVVSKLKKEVRRVREKLSLKEKAMAEKTQEYAETVKFLKNELKKRENFHLQQIVNLKQTCSKQTEKMKYLDEKNETLKKENEEMERKFEDMFQKKEKEKNDIFKGLETQLLERKLLKDQLEMIEGDHARMNKEKKQIEESYERVVEDYKKVKESFEKIKEENKLIEESHKIMEEEKKLLERNLLKEKDRCKGLEKEIFSKDSFIKNLQEESKAKQEELNNLEIDYKNRVTTLENQHALNVGKLEEMIQSKDNVLHRECEMYKDRLLQDEDKIKELVRTVEQLRSYIGEVRPSQEVEKLSETNQQLTDTMQILTDENNTLHSTVKLLNVRLSSILEIVSIQESVLTKNESLVGNLRDSVGLLTKWREKVFALMVQLRCQMIVEQEQGRKEEAKLSDLNTKLKDLERNHGLLRHKLADKEAALELEANQRTTTSQKLEKLNKEHIVVKNQQKQFLTQFQSLYSSSKAAEKKLVQSWNILNKTITRISSFDERIKFAGSRIHFLSEFLVDRDSKSKDVASCGENTLQESVYVNSDDLLLCDEQYLKEEVEKLLKERAVLLCETKKHNDILKQKTQVYEAVIQEKNERIEKLELSNAELKENICLLQNNFQTKSQELDEALETVEELKISQNRQRATLEKDHREAFEKERLQHTEDMTIIEGQLNDVRREHAKAVVALKNAERQVAREKEKANKMVGNIEREFSEKLSRCERQFKNVEKERNLLMVKVKEDKKSIVRARPLTGDQNNIARNEKPIQQKKKTQDQVSKTPTVATETKTHVDDEDTGGQENIKPIDPNEAFAALKDLKLLSQQIVEMHGNNENFISDSEC